jgi:hypothetical protein
LIPHVPVRNDSRTPLYARICHMKRTTLFVEESMDQELHVLARRKGVPVSALVRESLTRYVTEQKRGQKFALRFLGQGHSGRNDVAERHEQLLWRDAGPQAGKRPKKEQG